MAQYRRPSRAGDTQKYFCPTRLPECGWQVDTILINVPIGQSRPRCLFHGQGGSRFARGFSVESLRAVAVGQELDIDVPRQGEFEVRVI
jgi:hypothetical protein